MSNRLFRSTKEFDAFGPWIDEVHTVEDLPRLYRPAGVDPAAYRLVLKVPREIERRNATPDMHLYDHLLALDDESLTVLSRRGDRYDSLRVPLEQIVAIEESIHLLDGRLALRTADGTRVVVPYNAAGKGAIRNLIRLLRERYLVKVPPAGAQPPGTPPAGVAPTHGSLAGGGHRLGIEDTGLLNEYQRMVDEEPGMRLVYEADRQVLTPVSWLERQYRRIWPLTLHASIAATDGRELQIIHRRDWMTVSRDDLSLARTVLPRARISAVSVRPDERYLGLDVVIVQARAARIRFPVAAGPITDALRAAAGAVDSGARERGDR